MQISKKIVAILALTLACPCFSNAQNRVDSLRYILDTGKVPDSTFVKVCVELCQALVNTEKEFLLPEYALKGLDADTSDKDIAAKSALHEFLGNHYWQAGKLIEAAHQFNQIRLIGETSGNSRISANSYNGLGTVYYLMDNYELALDYYRKGLSLAGTDTLLRVRFYNNIANTFMAQDKMDSVLPYYDKSIDYHLSHQNFRYLSIAYANISLAYQNLRNGPEVRKNITLALEAAFKADDPYQIASIYEYMGDFSLDRHPDLAIENYNRALVLARKMESYDQVKAILNNLAYIYGNAGNYREANGYLTDIVELTDSLDMEQKKSNIRRMEAEHLDAIRNVEKMRTAQQDEVMSLKEKNRQQIMLIIVSVAFVSILILLLMGIHTYRLRIEISRTRERFFSMIAHDIRSPFSGILGISGILNEEADKSEDIVYRKQVNSLHKSLNHVYELLENLLQWSQSETGKIAFNPRIQLLSPFVHEVICLLSATGKQKGIRLENQIQSGLTARFDGNMLQTVIRNLLANAIKFSPENSTVYLSAEIQGKEVVVKVRDEGIGMDSKQLDRIFKAKKGISTPGTRNETGTGLGLILCKSFISKHGGRIWAESKPGSGTTVFFTLPD